MTLQVPAKVAQLIAEGALFVINNSGGKDSQAMQIFLRQIIPASQLMVVHAHLEGEEWEGVQAHVEGMSVGLPVVIATPVKTFAEMVERRGMFPSPQQRQCTSDLKRGPIDREIRRYLAANPQFNGKVVSCMGLRAQESSQRAKATVFKANARNSVAGREWFDWLPIHAISTEQVFAMIEAAGQKPHWAYEAGMSRLSCMFCIMASQHDLRTAARLNPQAYAERVALEQRVGHTISTDGRGLEEVTGLRVEDVLPANDDELVEAAQEQLILISCTKSKADRPMAAKDLYMASLWFSKARAYAEAQGVRWMILSAEHGLLDPETVIAPYDTTMLRMRKDARHTWASRVWSQLVQQGYVCHQLVFLAGEDYRENLELWATLDGREPDAVSVPMRGLGIGEQMAWLKAHTPAQELLVAANEAPQGDLFAAHGTIAEEVVDNLTAAVRGNREAWLNRFAKAARPVFAKAGYPLPENIRISVGFPSTGLRSNRIGECWAQECSQDGHFEIFIHPTLGEASRVADILTHELIHAAVGLADGHGKVFGACARKLGLEGKLTATTAGAAWHTWADPILAKLGQLPHASLAGGANNAPKKQGTRMIKAECDACGFTFRTTRKWLEGKETLRCPDVDCEGRVCFELPSEDEVEEGEAEGCEGQPGELEQLKGHALGRALEDAWEAKGRKPPSVRYQGGGWFHIVPAGCPIGYASRAPEVRATIEKLTRRGV